MNTEEIRKKFMPSKVEILLIAESPPVSGKFFYINSSMTSFTMQAFENAHGIEFKDTSHFLEYFRDSGCYLDDLTETPVNELEGTKREQLLLAGIDSLAERIKQMQPSVVVTVLKKIEQHVKEAIKKSGITPKTYTLPFPGNGHQKKYINGLSDLLRKHLPAKPNEPTDISSLFETWRVSGKQQNEWGLAWFLAYQFCRRFYASHGIVPHVIAHEGLGYYGIQLDHASCKVNQTEESINTLGRLTMAGDVENWRTGEAGDHKLKTSELCWNGLPTEKLVSLALEHMKLPIYPTKTHVNCRHKLWGSSYELMFEIAAILALRNPVNFNIWNAPYYAGRFIKELDPKATMQEHPGAFIFTNNINQIVIAGDGRWLDGSDRNFWEDYMSGSTSTSLAKCIEARLGALKGGARKV